MRLFIAAELPNEVIEALAETSAMLRSCIRGRYVAPDSFHVTLAFLGNVEPVRVNDAIDALEEGCKNTEAFDMQLGELGSFGRRSRATLWQGIRDSGQLPSVAESVREALRQRDLPFDGKPFRAHVTLMRNADLAGGMLPSPASAAGRIEAITLFKSDLSGSRPIYEALHVAKLDK